MNKPLEPETRVALEHLVYEHAWLIDHGAADRLPELYSNDGRMFGVGPDKIGREAITAWAKQRAAMTDRRSRHVQTNIRLERVSDDVIHGTAILTLYRHDGAGAGSPSPILIGEYSDIFTRSADRLWLFAERRLVVLFGSA
jgi:hypothetical protein